PTSLPDFNPIENVLRILKQRIKVRDHFPGTHAEMCQAVRQEWDRLEPSEWNGLIDSMSDRLKECCDHNGLQTCY
ncbi:hypothetical protein HOY80DRAFT_878501, partial [Tuber brumale]